MYALRPAIRLYGNIAQSFETPTTTEVVNRPEGGGGINPEIEPQTAVNYEIGIKAAPGKDISLEAALFLIQIEDELIAFRDATDRVFYRNAGRSQRKGIEVGLTKRLLHTGN
jgi:iron complex outermembrane recepter protein